MKQIAIIGATASGKSDLAIEIAQKNNAYILSLDSLSIYKEIDIVSAKPLEKELNSVKHFGIDEIYPNENFSVFTFFEIYNKAKVQAEKDNKNLIIVGGTSFYLKSMIDGLSQEPNYSKETLGKVKDLLINLDDTYKKFHFLNSLNINDRYRIEKYLSIYFETNLLPNEYFKQNQKKIIINDIQLFEILVEKDIIRKRIELRTDKMFKMGLIDEISYLEKKYSRLPNSLKAIGIKEVLNYFDGIYDKKEMKERIIIHTYQLAKRQTTFNKTQFNNVIKGSLDNLKSGILSNF